MNSANTLNPRWAALIATMMSVLLIAVFHGTAADMVRIWTSSGTFTHAFLVLPISVWLMWERRAHLVSAGFRPTALPLLALAGSGVLWVMGEAISGAVVSHFALVFMLISVVWLVWGHRAAWLALFPLAFLLFAVPFGEFMVPTLMDYTAHFTVVLLRASGIPVYQEGMSFVIPSGRWSVVEACSGIRYLIASLMVGVLFAYLNYRSWRRRFYFVIASLIVPLIANWLRAYLIVMMGHLSGNRLAVGADHLIYGWVFFGLVIGILFWVGGLWREPDLPAPEAPAQAPMSAGMPTRSALLILLAALVIIALPRPIYSWLVNLPPAKSYDIPLAQPAAGWQASFEPRPLWKALSEGEQTSSVQRFTRGKQQVVVQMAYFANQSAGHELIQFGNRLVAPEDKVWGVVESSVVPFSVGEEPLAFEQAVISGGTAHLVALRTNWLGESVTVSERAAKLDLLKSRLLRQPDDSAFVVIWTLSGDNPAEAEQLLADFVRDNWSAIETALQHTAKR